MKCLVIGPVKSETLIDGGRVTASLVDFINRLNETVKNRTSRWHQEVVF